MATPIRIKRSAVPGKRPQVSDLQVGELALNTYDAELVTLRDRFAATGIATGVVPLGAGATVTNVLYVTGDGDDNNTGKKLGDAKASIAGAVAISTTGDVIRVSAGTYTENNPIALPPQVSIVGDSLREVTVVPSNAGSDLFHVAPGNYITEMSFTGTMNAGKAIAAFNPNVIRYFNQSAYVRNCTNFVTNSIGLKIDGNDSIGPFKSMVTDSFTQYNSNGIGCSISNEGYAQIVSMFTINNDIGVVCNSGGQCDVTNSNSSFGNYGMISDGKAPRKYTGIVTASADADADTFALDVGITTSNISGFLYDNVSGLATVTTSGAHGFEVGMGVTLSSMTLSCNYGSGTHRFVSADSNAVNVQSGAEAGNEKTPNGATYVPSTGVLTLTFASAHGMSTSDTITLDNESITFTCAADDYATEHEYPRVSDPIAGVTTAVTVGTTTSFTIEVGSVPLQNKVYPDGNVGYVFDVKSVPDTTSFTVNVGPSKYAHTYVSGGNAKIDIIRPFDGQVVYFDSIYEEVEKITITNGGSGYTSPPTVTIDAPGTAWGIQATAVATIVNGTVNEITIVSTGRGYSSTPSITITGAATASLTMKPILYSVKSSTPVSSGITTVTLNDNVPYAVGVGTTVPFHKQSRIIASSHSFEYIGTGVDPIQSLPQKGAVPIQDNEIDDRNGGLTIFTSTDQTGNFRIGDGVIIDQQSGTITGEFYSKSLFSQMTPFILALGGD
tara:strand:- start:3918 stop:6092 length:2175 start_codon:yes stop_codon:yes gene_type:complete